MVIFCGNKRGSNWNKNKNKKTTFSVYSFSFLECSCWSCSFICSSSTFNRLCWNEINGLLLSDLDLVRSQLWKLRQIFFSLHSPESVSTCFKWTIELLRCIYDSMKYLESFCGNTECVLAIIYFYKQFLHIKYLDNYLLKVNKKNTRTRCEICSKLTIKTSIMLMMSFWCIYC